MSTKTTIKRVALVAAVALTLGGFSAVSASAAVPTITLSSAYDTVNKVQLTSGYATYTVTPGTVAATSTRTNVSVSGEAIISATSADTHSVVSGVTSTGFIVTNDGTSSNITVVVQSTVVGSAVITVLPYDGYGLPGTAVTSTLTWSDSANAKASAANTTIYGNDADTTIPTSTSDSSVNFTGVAAKGTTAVARFLVSLADGNKNAVKTDTITVTVAGPGLLGAVSDSTTGVINNGNVRAISQAVDSTRGTAEFVLYGDGTSGNTTLTFADGTTVLGTKTYVFSGSIATIAGVAQTVNLAKAAASYTTNHNTRAIKVTAADAAGNPVSGTVYATSSDLTVINDSYAAVTVTAGVGYYTPSTPLKAGTANITFTNGGSASTTTITSAPVALAVAASQVAASITLAWDAATYAPGDKMTLTLTAKDSAGNPIADSDTNTGYTLLSTAGLVFSQTIASAPAAAATVKIKGGVATYTMYAPYFAGPISVSATTDATSANLATALQGVAVTAATATVTGSQDSALAVDAANAATDAANAAAEEASNATEAASEALAAVNALATTVASLIAGIKAQLTALTALVKKLQK
jgi:hypothetical protein